MLGSLSRKLRALGFDTLYYREGDDGGILKLCADEARVLLTADRALAATARARRIPVLLVEGRRDSTRIHRLGLAAQEAGLALVKGNPLCSVCGGPLVRLQRTQVMGKVPASVQSRHRAFFRCTACGKYYWKGDHWKKLRWLGRRLSDDRDASFTG